MNYSNEFVILDILLREDPDPGRVFESNCKQVVFHWFPCHNGVWIENVQSAKVV